MNLIFCLYLFLGFKKKDCKYEYWGLVFDGFVFGKDCCFMIIVWGN